MNALTIPSGSPINEESLETQNERLLRYLKDAGITIYSRQVRVGRIDCKEYSLKPFMDHM